MLIYKRKQTKSRCDFSSQFKLLVPKFKFCEVKKCKHTHTQTYSIHNSLFEEHDDTEKNERKNERKNKKNTKADAT